MTRGIDGFNEAVTNLTGPSGPVSDLSAEMLELKRSSVDTIQPMQDALTAEEQFAEGARLAAADTFAFAGSMEATEQRSRTYAATTDGLTNSILNLSDPVYRAVSALDSLQTELRRADEDGERTAEEMLNIARRTLEAQAAFDSVSTDNINATISMLARSLGLTADEARDVLVQLGILDGTDIWFSINGSWNIPPPPVGFLPNDISFTTPSGIMGFADGGIVPGPIGAPMPAIVHGGEEVIPVRDRQRGGGTTVNVTVEGSVATERDLAVGVARQLERLRKSGATI